MSAEEKTRITVDIFGTNYKLVGKSSVSYMKMIAAHVNDQMYHLSNALPQLESSKIAVLASVNIADEFFKLRKEMEHLQGESQKSSELEEKYQKLLQQTAELNQDNKAWQEKESRAMEHNNLLQQELLGLQSEVQAALQQHQAQQEYLQNIEQQLIQAQNEKAAEQQQHSNDQELVQEHRKLTVEYEKLKKEYNEWIQLVMEKDEPS
jgi:cell division protein ZapA (FtsZ GTPase activity inhibitor)